MVMLSAHSALVAGSITAEDAMKKQTIKVTRGFLYQGKPLASGSIVEVDAELARELVAMGKATKCDPPAKPAPRAPRVDTPKDETK
jgi:hypothetical protein